MLAIALLAISAAALIAHFGADRTELASRPDEARGRTGAAPTTRSAPTARDGAAAEREPLVVPPDGRAQAPKTAPPTAKPGDTELRATDLADAIAFSRANQNPAGGYVAQWLLNCFRYSVPDDDLTTVADSKLRAWALHSLRDSCSDISNGLTPDQRDEMLRELENRAFAQELSQLTQLSRQGGAEPVDRRVAELLSGTTDPSQIHALLLAQEKYGTPLSEQPAFQSVSGDTARVRKILGAASLLLACGRIGGCSANHPVTAMYCVENGCTPQSTLQSGVMSNLTGAEQQSLSAFMSWFELHYRP